MEFRRFDGEVSVYKSPEWKRCIAELTAHYGEPNRFYHGMAHVKDCLDQLSRVPASYCENRELIELALWFHDVIYDPTLADNESVSADFAAEWLVKLRLAPEDIERVKELIQITDHRGEPKTADECLIVDIDLSILGREPEVYARYAASIRREYAHVDENEYREGRKAVLRNFLGRALIFRTEFFREKYEFVARKNLETEILALL